MRRLITVSFFVSLMLLLLHDTLQASRSHEPVSPGATRLELIVFESPSCIYCGLIRRDVLPLYERSPNSQDIPMRFVDLMEVDTNALDLREPLRVLPTIVLMKDGAEVERVAGYIGPELFFHAISHMIRRAGD